MEEHEPIVEDRGVRRYKDRHDERRRRLCCFHGCARRASIDYFGAGFGVDREPVRGYSQFVSLGMERSSEDRRRHEYGQDGIESKLNDENIKAYAPPSVSRWVYRLLRTDTCGAFGRR